jgi:hypothetical protein
MEATGYPSYIMDELAQSPAPQPGLSTDATLTDATLTPHMSEYQVGPHDVLMAEDTPDINMKIRDSEFKMKGVIIQLNNRISKLELDMKLCCPNYDKLATNIQSRFRGNKDRIETIKNNPEYTYNNTKGWVIIKNVSGFNPTTTITYAIQDRYKLPRVARDKRHWDKIDIMKKNHRYMLGFWVFLMPKGPDNHAPGELPLAYAAAHHAAHTPAALKHILENIRKSEMDSYRCDYYVKPGVPVILIKQKMKEGFEIEFEHERDSIGVKLITLKGSLKKKKRKSKRNKSNRQKPKRKKSERKKSKRDKSKRDKSKRNKSNRKKSKRNTSFISI